MKLRHNKTGYLVEVTHWNHFWVNRMTGLLINKAATYTYLEGHQRGMTFVSSLVYIKSNFTKVRT